LGLLQCFEENPWNCQKIGSNLDQLSRFTVPLFIVIYLLAVGGIALILQMQLPLISPVLGALGLGSSLVPLIVIYASLELADERGPVLAVLLGLLVDLSSHHHLGNTVLVLFALSALIATQAQKPESHSWLFRLTFVLVGTFLFFVLSYLLTLIEIGRWSWPFAVWNKVVFGTLLNVVLAPLCFVVVGWLPRRFGWRPAHELHDPYGHARG
jgi:rod shape-determining protein MreD